MLKASFNPNIPNLLYRLDYRVYSRPFRIPLHTHHGAWTERQGILIRLSTKQGHISFGEIAPLPWFGSESLEEALDLCKKLGPFAKRTDLLSLPENYPASQFGFESAIESLQTAIAQQESIAIQASSQLLNQSQNTKPDNSTHDSIKTLPSVPPCCQLLPTGKAALTAWQISWNKGSQSFKWKIGVDSVQSELTLFRQLFASLPPAATIRLDANGGLSMETARQWLDLCDQLNNQSHSQGHPQYASTPLTDFRFSKVPTIEFLEQPLPPDRFEDLLYLSRHYQTPLALDESVATFTQLEDCYKKGWRSVFVVKAAIAGSPSRLRQFCRQHKLDVVWSSVLETAIARQFIINHLIPTVPSSARSLGFGVEQWFKSSSLDQTEPEYIWNSCGESCQLER
ncbi:MAG: o-succinylbenzoate synthase [Cyanobacteria bacterium P01_F01_bin.150]